MSSFARVSHRHRAWSERDFGRLHHFVMRRLRGPSSLRVLVLLCPITFELVLRGQEPDHFGQTSATSKESRIISAVQPFCRTSFRNSSPPICRSCFHHGESWQPTCNRNYKKKKKNTSNEERSSAPSLNRHRKSSYWRLDISLGRNSKNSRLAISLVRNGGSTFFVAIRLVSGSLRFTRVNPLKTQNQLAQVFILRDPLWFE